MLDFRKPTDEVVVVRYYGTDIAAGEVLQPDGSWMRHGMKSGKRFVRPDAERFVAENEAKMAGMSLHLWIVS
jgi:hypothetical protein